MTSSLVWLVLVMTMSASMRGNLITSISQKQAVEAGSSLELECGLEPVPHMAEVAWVRVKEVGEVEYLSIYSKEEGVTDYDEEFLSSMESLVWRLVITEVVPSMAGLYQCQVLLGNEMLSSREVMVTVLDPDSVAHTTRYLISKHGGNITLDCTDLDGEDANWTRVGDSSVVQNGKQLSLIRVDRSDSGIYVCSVSGGSRTINISLLVEHSPTIIPREATISQAPGYPASLRCEITAVPVPVVTWYRLGLVTGPVMLQSHGDLALSIEEYKDGVVTSSLVLDKVTGGDYGQYSCNASNHHGQASGSIQLLYSAQPVHSTAQYTGLGRGVVLLLLLQIVRTLLC
jgi:hypothetical protein